MMPERRQEGSSRSQANCVRLSPVKRSQKEKSANYEQEKQEGVVECHRGLPCF